MKNLISDQIYLTIILLRVRHAIRMLMNVLSILAPILVVKMALNVSINMDHFLVFVLPGGMAFTVLYAREIACNPQLGKCVDMGPV